MRHLSRNERLTIAAAALASVGSGFLHGRGAVLPFVAVMVMNLLTCRRDSYVPRHLIDAFEASESAVAVVRASDGVLVGVNAAFERITGHDRGAVVGRLPIEAGLWPEPEFPARSGSFPRSGPPLVGPGLCGGFTCPTAMSIARARVGVPDDGRRRGEGDRPGHRPPPAMAEVE